MRIKMADVPHTQSVLCLVTFMCFIILMSAVGMSADSLSGSAKSISRKRYRRQASVSYHLQLTRPQAISEDAPDDAVLYDFKSVSTIDGEPISNFNLQVTTNDDSQPQDVSLFTIDSQRQLVFSDLVPREERRQNYLNYEQYTEITVIIEASLNMNTGGDKHLIELTVPLSDVNDELPVLKNQPVPYLASIPVDSREGDTVYILLAEDPDTNSALRYSIDVDQLGAGSVISSIFKMEEVVDQSTSMLEGHIKIAIGPDFTLADNFIIPVRIQDTQGDPRFPPQNITANVDVLVGPRAPQFFQRKYEGSIFESKTTNNPVYMGSGSSEELIIKVHQFQENFPMVLRLVKDNSVVSTQFRIDEEGKVYNTESLEFDIKKSARPPKYQLYVKVVQTLDDSTTIEDSVPLEITIKDENDNTPKFEYTQYLQTIPEDTEPDSSILRVLAEDNDSGKNAELDYELINDYFRIEKRVINDKTFGDIYVKKKLDFDAEPGPIYRFSIAVKDNGSPVLSSTVDVFITTSNVNDEPPVLEPQESLILKDDVKVSATSEYILTRMRAKDIDGDDIKFYFKNSNSNGPTRLNRIEIFEINPLSGIITVIAEVPQNIDSYYLTVIAVDDGSCCSGSNELTDETSFVVEIVDTTNQKPVFEDCLSLNPSVEEASPSGTPVVTVSASDSGRGVNGMVEYSIESPNPNLPDANFEIDKDTGVIIIKNPVDREPNVNFKQITVKAADKAESPQEGWCTFRVQIVDINDNDPVFVRDYEQEVPSTLSPPRSALRVGATDKDIGNNGKISYHLTNDGGGVFGIYKDTGVIIVNKTFTPGILEYNLVVKAEDHGETPRSATANVRIILKASENTQSPEFKPAQSTYEYSMAENVKPGSAEAVITTLQCESRIDTDPRVQFFLVSEDGDLAPQGLGKFSINTFRVGSLTYVNVSVADDLDFETEQTHDIVLRCQNFAALVMFKDIVLRVNVLDRNDNRPYFAGTVPTTGRYAGSIPENMETEFTVVDNIQGYDDDISADFSQLHFSIQEEVNVSEYFTIKSLPGNRAAITSSHRFDREAKERYYLTVIADDIRPSDLTPGAQPNTATAVVEVIIEDTNDNAMTFDKVLYSQSVKETANIGEVIFAVTAFDRDEVDQGRLRYSFTQPPNLPFDIRDQTGDIFVTSKLDFESGKTEYLMTLESRDSSNIFSATTQVKITVLDENDNIPKFSQPEYLVDGEVEEEDSSINFDNPRFLVQVHADDADVSRNETKIRYYLLGKGTVPGDQQIFTINENTGEIHLVAILDRDTTPESIFTVEALDEEKDPQKGYVNVRVRPRDINDNYPEFDQESLVDSVDEGIPEGEFITQVEATDLDAGQNAEIEYEIVNSPATTDGSQTNYFRVQPNGQIYSQVAPEYFDREQNPEFQVVIRAKDKGLEPLSSTATLTIKLLDINDNVPEFTEDVYSVLMSENTESGIIKEVVAIDQDIDKNAALRYILPQDLNQNNRHFTITSTNNKGYIQVSNPVDYEIKEQRHFMLQIKVQDSDDTHVDMAFVNITVEDFNDNPPVFNISYQEVNIKEGEPPGDIVATFIATDKDSGINALKSFEIERKSNPRREFHIDPDTGAVQTRKTLDREVEATMSVIIHAIDQGDPQLTGTATLHVVVDDVNDNFPIFKEDYRPVVEENQIDAKYPLFVEQVFAIDLDTPLFGPNFGFALPDPCTDIACEKFMLTFDPDADDGRGTANITTNSVFDREEKKEYELPIVMWDMRGTNNPLSQTGTNTLTIVIGDVNDNEPFPGHQDIFAQKFGDNFGSFVIGRVYVEDLDDGDLADKTFTYISPSSLASSFLVNRDTGDITMNKGVKANFGGTPYNFKVSVYDRVFDKTVTCTVSVIVKELTEEAIMKSGSVRLADITASEFIQKPMNRRTGNREDSLYTKFRVLMADKLGYPGVENIEITTLRDGDDYLEVRYAAHGSPYLTPAEVDNVIIMNKADFENLGLTVMSIPVDECEDEIFEGGCYNKLNITNEPVTINADGTSFVGVNAFLVATEGCRADVFPDTSDCSGDYCYNGGTCHKDEWGTLSCQNCPRGFTGARCQERRHHFDGNSITFYKTLLQCEESQTSIEFVTDTKDGVLLYNGPMNALDPLQNPQDFILLKLEDGFPVLYIDHGTGILELRIDGKDNTGKQLLQSLADGEWHHLDINRNGKDVELVVDRCNVAEDVNGIVEDTKACRVAGETPGVNMYLNVNTLLQLGGVRVFETVNQLSGITTPGFVGCMRNLIHNKELYNLHYRDVDGINTGKNGCPFEDEECGIPQNTPKCINGRCEANMNGYSFCICDAGYFGERCNRKTTIRDFDKDRQSYYYWQMKDQFYNTLTKNKELSAHIRFRSRQLSGNLLYLNDQASSSAQDIQLKLHNGKVQLTYDLGGGRKTLEMTNAQATNGQWHTLSMERYGTEFHLRLDNGEGRNYVYTLGGDPNERSIFRTRRHVYSGGYKEDVNGRQMLKDNLKSTCIEDVRVNNGYFAMNAVENSLSDSVAQVIENPATSDGCNRTDCDSKTCPGRTCVELWEDHECRCNPGYYQVGGSQCWSLCTPNPCFNNVSCSLVKNEVSCQCPPGWRGQLCDERNPEEVSSADLSSSALAAIIVSIIVVLLLVIVVVLLYKFCGRSDDGEKFILEVDPEDDIRENVMNYDEEGAGEEDQDAYDISRLQKPNFETSNRPYDPDKRRDVHRRDAPGDKPDVGVFIEDRLQDADEDDGAPPHDSVREFTFEGGDSDAGSLSSLNTSSSDRSQDYDYLNEWGPKFAKLADMYGAGQDLES